MICLNLFLSSLIIFYCLTIVNPCLRTESVTMPIVTEEPELRNCSQTDIALGNPNAAQEIDVIYDMYNITQIPGTLDTIATMNLQCTADEGNFASMTFNTAGEPVENSPPNQTVTIMVQCSSVDMMWKYSATSMGVTCTTTITSAFCQQA
ncbi:hypothetical protein CRE_12958 [Caenorhabditis remanei]|uniref:C6 domain-containing protein n=1 Tax=Caenorhabditis remanei TaxID=31234 RepID=E3N0Z2_CAERE|nr:hypothetical protein CRE_12958 [Caenorhabditis remanei]